MAHLPVRLIAAAALLALAACGQGQPDQPGGAGAAAVNTQADATPQEGGEEDEAAGGAVSDATARDIDPPRGAPLERVVDWRPRKLDSGEATVSCAAEYGEAGDGVPVANLGYSAMRRAMAPCAATGVLRVRYHGKVAADFTALIERTVELADTLGIQGRILDMDSSGGQIEEAIRAGDVIGESGWTVWVREGSVCHSSCVLLLAAGDMRMVAGDVGIHRMIRIGSSATSRAELQHELQEVHGQVREYLQRNGVAFAVADLMMTVPNRGLRLLTAEEMDRYGLSGQNAVADDLQRIRLAQKCGESFVRRKDAFFRAFDRECRAGESEVGAMGECGVALRKRYGFPDQGCPAESPLSEYDAALAADGDGGGGGGERS